MPQTRLGGPTLVRVHRIVVLACAASAAILAVYHLQRIVSVFSAGGLADDPFQRMAVPIWIAFDGYALTASLAAVAVALTAWQRAEARALATFLALAGLSADQIALETLLGGGALARGPTTATVPFIALVSALGLAALVRFTQLFPRPLARETIEASWQRSRISRGAAVLARTHAASLDPRQVWGAGILLAILLAVARLPLMIGAAAAIAAFAALVGALNLRAAWLAEDASGRQKMLLVFEAMLLGGVVLALDAALIAAKALFGFELPFPAWELWLLIGGFWAGLLMLVVAVFLRRALDSGRLVRRTLVLGAIGPLFVFLFAGIENVASSVFAEWLGMSESVGQWIAAGTLAIAFGPLHERLTRATRRWFGDAAPNVPVAPGDPGPESGPVPTHLTD